MKNKGEKQYKICNTYSQWEKYAQSKLPTEILNYEDFVHWLINQRRMQEKGLETIKLILLPIYFLMISLLYQMFPGSSSLILSLIIMPIVIFAASMILWKEKISIEFWNDWIQLANKYRKEI